MINEAFEKWAIDYGLDYEPSFTRYDVEASWQAAQADSEREIAELKAENQQYWEYIEKLAKEHEVDCVGDYGGVFDVPLDKLQKFAEAYHKAMCEVKASSTRVATQPLNRLSDKAIGDCLNKAELSTIMLNPIVVEKLDNFANAIMDAMQELNK